MLRVMEGDAPRTNTHMCRYEPRGRETRGQSPARCVGKGERGLEGQRWWLWWWWWWWWGGGGSGGTLVTCLICVVLDGCVECAFIKQRLLWCAYTCEKAYALRIATHVRSHATQHVWTIPLGGNPLPPKKLSGNIYYLSIYLSISLSIYLSISLSFYLSFLLSIYLCI